MLRKGSEKGILAACRLLRKLSETGHLPGQALEHTESRVRCTGHATDSSSKNSKTDGQTVGLVV